MRWDQMMTLFLKSLFWIMVAFLFLSSVLPFSKVAHGAIRGLTLPREQFFVVTIAMILVWLTMLDPQPKMYALVVLGVVAAIHFGYIVKFTPLWPRQSVDASAVVLANTDNHVTILAANIKQSNRQFDRLMDLIKEEQPEIVTALEVDQEWVDALYDALKA
jgi:endonuclease/exonuclease/phosphatase (EEP) superfamily protein YafD